MTPDRLDLAVSDRLDLDTIPPCPSCAAAFVAHGPEDDGDHYWRLDCRRCGWTWEGSGQLPTWRTLSTKGGKTGMPEAFRALIAEIDRMSRALRGAREIVHVTGPVRQERAGLVPLWKLAAPAHAEDVVHFLEVAELTATGTPK